MRFYNRQHRHYCGIDLHVKTMYVCVLDAAGQTLVHRNVKATPEALLETIAPYRDGLVVAAECMFTWYWLADLCAAEEIAFVLGQALAMKAIHGGKAKNDKLDSFKIATLLRGGLLPQAYTYPAAMRATRDLLRRRLHLVRKRGQLLAHIQNTRAQYQRPAFGRRLAYPANRAGISQHFPDPIVRKTIDVDLALLERYDGLIPYEILSGSAQGISTSWTARQYLAVVAGTFGAVIYFRCLWDFAVTGRGIPAPVDHPKRLVVRGLYRYARNPMYLGVLFILLAESAFFGSSTLLMYTVGWFLLVQLVVVLYEEPNVAAQVQRFIRALHARGSPLATGREISRDRLTLSALRSSRAQIFVHRSSSQEDA